MDHELFFIKPELKQGLNLTVRNGERWYRKVEPGDLVQIKETGTTGILAVGRVRGIAYIPYVLIPQEWLALEHDSACRTPEGLLQEMIRAYPDFNGKGMVTLILFEIE